jgi:ankyrin repeat protein
MNLAAEKGHLEVIKWLHENRDEGCTSDAMDWAAKNGHQEVVKYLRENNLV